MLCAGVNLGNWDLDVALGVQFDDNCLTGQNVNNNFHDTWSQNLNFMTFTDIHCCERARPAMLHSHYLSASKHLNWSYICMSCLTDDTSRRAQLPSWCPCFCWQLNPPRNVWWSSTASLSLTNSHTYFHFRKGAIYFNFVIFLCIFRPWSRNLGSMFCRIR